MKVRLKLLDILRESTGIEPFPFQNTKTITIINDNGKEVSVNCELALTPKEKMQGLLHRDSLCNNCGVLFESDGGGYHMDGMNFPIDMVFINDGIIVEIVNAKPGDEGIEPNIDFTHNLEVNDGFCDNNNISEGCEIAL